MHIRASHWSSRTTGRKLIPRPIAMIVPAGSGMLDPVVLRSLTDNGFVTTFDSRACRLSVNESISANGVHQE
jgi:hypothetical protein